MTMAREDRNYRQADVEDINAELEKLESRQQKLNEDKTLYNNEIFMLTNALGNFVFEGRGFFCSKESFVIIFLALILLFSYGSSSYSFFSRWLHCFLSSVRSYSGLACFSAFFFCKG
jgi:hypothetical protein